jgi:hypothetical protein
VLQPVLGFTGGPVEVVLRVIGAPRASRLGTGFLVDMASAYECMISDDYPPIHVFRASTVPHS